MTDYFKNSTFLVTGVAGFIGSHLCQELLTRGAYVLGVDMLITGQEQNLDLALQAASQANPELSLQQIKDRFTFVKADVNQPVENYLPDFDSAQIKAILHFASPASPPIYQAYPRLTYLVNTWATHQLLNYVLMHQPAARFLFASTSEVYGDPQVHPQPETYWGHVNPNGPRSCYDEAKRLGEAICGIHERDLDLDTRIVRIFNTYGPRMDIDDGRVIPNFIKQALQGRRFTVYGDGSQTRSYCYIDDLVEGILRTLAYDDMRGQTVNLGNPDEYTVLETAQEIKQAVGGSFKPEKDLVFRDLPQDDPSRRKPDISKAKKELTWQPKVDFRQGLRKTIDFFKKAPF
jgi:nucleoside-diphosphate-sugar epimerase